ncbi:MAG: extracellular solute-binding protein, partial [Bacilli bacterium]|nr:extracellular solute-binding protein [Bacilli bacterium]
MKKLVLILTFLFTLTLMVGALTGCEKEQTQNGGELTKDATVNVYSWWDPAHDGLTGMKAGFEEKYADYNVTLNFVKISSYYQTMLTKLAGAKLAGGSSEQIDVMMLASDKIPLFASNETILALDDYVTDEYLSDLYPAVKDGLYYEDSVYAVARDVTTKCMVLNVDVFNKYNIPLPDEDWTVQDFKDICLQFAAQSDNVWGYSFDSNPDPLYLWFYLFGGEYFNAETNESLINTAGSKVGVKFLYDLIEADGIMSLSETTEYGGFSASFIGGYAAMISGGLSQVNAVETAGANFIVLPLPTGTSGEKQSHTFLNCWTIPSCTSNAAWA